MPPSCGGGPCAGHRYFVRLLPAGLCVSSSGRSRFLRGDAVRVRSSSTANRRLWISALFGSSGSCSKAAVSRRALLSIRHIFRSIRQRRCWRTGCRHPYGTSPQECIYIRSRMADPAWCDGAEQLLGSVPDPSFWRPTRSEELPGGTAMEGFTCTGQNLFFLMRPGFPAVRK